MLMFVALIFAALVFHEGVQSGSTLDAFQGRVSNGQVPMGPVLGGAGGGGPGHRQQEEGKQSGIPEVRSLPV